MRLTEVLHPEVMLNKRGSRVSRQMYQDVFEVIDLDPNDQTTLSLKGHPTESQKRLLSIMMEDDIFAQHMVLCKKFKQEHGKTYRLGKDIAKVFSKIDRDIPVDILPASFLGYISFPPETIADEGGFVEGGYVCICPKGEGKRVVPGSVKIEGEEDASSILWMSYVQEGKEGMGPITGFLMPLLEEKVSRLIQSAPTSDFMVDRVGFSTPSKETMKSRDAVYRALINAVVYIHSEQPWLELARPVSQSNVSKKSLAKNGQVINECEIPVTFVFRDYHGVVYTKDKTWVSPHPRWQRCGGGLKQVKLVWVAGHERQYREGV